MPPFSNNDLTENEFLHLRARLHQYFEARSVAENVVIDPLKPLKFSMRIPLSRAICDATGKWPRKWNADSIFAKDLRPENAKRWCTPRDFRGAV
jgi:hypothetical protein